MSDEIKQYGYLLVEIGEGDVELPPPDYKYPVQTSKSKTNFYGKKVTIYNDIAADSVNDRHFDRFVIDKCNIQGGIVSRTDGTIENIVNAVTVITKDVAHYKQPLEYIKLPVDIKEEYYTVQVGDFVVLAEVDDIVTTSREFAELQNKYKDNGIVVRSVSPNIHGMGVDNVTIANVG